MNDFFILLFKTNNTVAKPFYLEMYAVNIGNTCISCQLLSIYLYLKEKICFFFIFWFDLFFSVLVIWFFNLFF